MIQVVAALGAALGDLQSIATAITAPATAPTGPHAKAIAPGAGTSFSDALKSAIGKLDGTIAAANASAKSFASGNHDIPLSDVMLSLEQANLALQMAATVRDKVVAAYSNIMNMQV